MYLLPFLILAEVLLTQSFLVPRSHFASASPTKLSAASPFETWLESLMFWKPKTEMEQQTSPPKPVAIPVNAVLVFGATGKTGQEVVKQLLSADREVVVAARNETKMNEVFASLALSPLAKVHYRPNIDITDTTTVNAALFQGVSQIVSALGPVFGDAAMTSEAIDYTATAHILQQFQQSLAQAPPSSQQQTSQPLVRFSKEARSLEQWSRLDDVIMGGRSSSSWAEVDWAGEGGEYCRWGGQLVTQGGGFCGTVIREIKFDTEGYDGIQLRVRGDGNRYKFRLKPDDAQLSRNERQYQAQFDTVQGQWIEVQLPFDRFVAVRRNDVDYDAPPVNTAAPRGAMTSLGFVLSRFSFNEQPNPRCTPGPFSLDVGEVGLYRSPRPAVVLVSSAGTERVNKLMDEEACKRDIPIVQLNPQGILNWKYKGETLLRQSGLPYSVIRATGLATPPLTAPPPDDLTPAATQARLLLSPRRLELSQGDSLSGRITRQELGVLVAAALHSPYASGATFEARRDETASGELGTPASPNNWDLVEGPSKNSPPTPSATASSAVGQNLQRLFRALVRDADRDLGCSSGGSSSAVLPPFPIARDPPAPVTEQRVQEILADPRVRTQQTREAGARVGTDAK